jgi:hypothetical protein
MPYDGPYLQHFVFEMQLFSNGQLKLFVMFHHVKLEEVVSLFLTPKDAVKLSDHNVAVNS